jgi:P-type E1-E2 ATPase
VASVPEGLPVCITVTLTIVTKHMYQHYVPLPFSFNANYSLGLVKRLPTAETLGPVDIIASDNTGTLAENKMTVIHVYQGSQLVNTYDQNGLLLLLLLLLLFLFFFLLHWSRFGEQRKQSTL